MCAAEFVDRIAFVDSTTRDARISVGQTIFVPPIMRALMYAQASAFLRFMLATRCNMRSALVRLPDKFQRCFVRRLMMTCNKQRADQGYAPRTYTLPSYVAAIPLSWNDVAEFQQGAKEAGTVLTFPTVVSMGYAIARAVRKVRRRHLHVDFWLIGFGYTETDRGVLIRVQIYMGVPREYGEPNDDTITIEPLPIDDLADAIVQKYRNTFSTRFDDDPVPKKSK